MEKNTTQSRLDAAIARAKAHIFGISDEHCKDYTDQPLRDLAAKHFDFEIREIENSRRPDGLPDYIGTVETRVKNALDAGRDRSFKALQEAWNTTYFTDVSERFAEYYKREVIGPYHERERQARAAYEPKVA